MISNKSDRIIKIKLNATWNNDVCILIFLISSINIAHNVWFETFFQIN